MANTASAPPLLPEDEEMKDSGLMAEGVPWGVEKVYDYESGGHHPVHLGDILHQRYKIFHKLGSGGFANVWLCRDTSTGDSFPRYVAMKVIMAEGSTPDCPELQVCKLAEKGLGRGLSGNLFCFPLDRFEIEGPNGLHYAFVYPVLGPRVSQMPTIIESENPGPQLRAICLQVAQAMATLHDYGICHGDFRPANILARLSGLDGISEGALLDIIGRPETTRVMTHSEEDHDMPTAPHYLVYPVDWDALSSTPSGAKLMTNEPCVNDFGECFDISTPTEQLGIPQVYCPPEYTLEQKLGISSDVWALGCTLFEIRTGRKLFDMFDDDEDECLTTMAVILGKFPEPWWSTTWAARRDFLQDETDSNGLVVGVDDRGDVGSGESDGGRFVEIQPSEPRSIRDAITRGLEYTHRNRGLDAVRRSIPAEEADLLADLLGKLLRYDPSERISPREVLEHEWFKFEEEAAVVAS